LRQIPHLVIREASEAGVCCGSAGIYNLVQPQEADALGELKANDLAHTGAAVVASANIGCSLQIRKHLQRSGHPQTVAHPLQLLARSAGLSDATG
jgi:glycolate oxidase iron-sulfur subunit